MQFISLEFLIFLPVFFTLYWALRKYLRWQNLLVIGGSYFFYGWADWRFTFLLAGYTIVSFLSGLFLQRTDKRSLRKLILWSVVAINLGVLGLYKYYDFFITSFSRVFSQLGFEADWATLNLVLPIGISFFTFQALSYTIDVYHRRIEPIRNPIPYFAFLSFFPQMVAGPIERADELLPQFQTIRKFNYDSAVYGMKRILWGLVKKMFIADNCAIIVNEYFPESAELSSLNLWILIFMFAMQVYGDFSGYSDIAVGCGRLLGIRLTENFRLPYLSASVKELWQRWHISLNRWFLHYVYIPLGGSRKGTATTILNILIVFTLSGLWHGAEWSYMVWGFYHGCLLALAILVAWISARLSLPTHDYGAGKIGRVLKILSTFLLFLIGLVFFRSHSVIIALHYILDMFSFRGGLSLVDPFMIPVLCYIAIFSAAEIFGRNLECPICFPSRGIFSIRWIRWGFYWLLTIATFILAGSATQFIYYKF